MFMGDSGSMLLGFLMATSMISLTGQIDPSQVTAGPGLAVNAHLPLFLPLAVMALAAGRPLLPGIRRTMVYLLWFQPTSSTCTTACSNWGTVTAARQCAAVAVDGGARWRHPDRPDHRPWAIAALLAGFALAAWLTWKPVRYAAG
ncbi:MAG: hypothetical protein R2742_03920 [Micropruina glycogenica]